MLSRFSFGAVLLVGVIASACDRVPLLAPTASTIVVAAQTRTLPPGGSTEITATVVESGGTPVHDGTLVRFSASLGRVEPAEAETRGGIARTTFIAGSTSGTAQIRATSGAASGGAGETPGNLVEILIGGAAATAVTVSATPARLGPSGGTVTIIASALDGSGNRLAGVPITFSTTAGTLSASSALSDANGEARVTLTTNREADVTARAGAQSATAKVTIAPAGTVTLTTSPANPLSGSPVTLTVAPATGTVPRVVIDWGDGATTDLGTVAGSRTVTHTYFRSGPYTITATSTSDDETFTTATSVTVASGASITLSAVSPTNPLAGSPITLTVTPAAGTAPRVVMDWGDGSSSDLNIVSSARGVAHTYSSAGSYIITATATAGGDTFSTSTAVTVAGRTISVNIADNRGGSPDRCQPVLFTANVTPASESITSYQWTIDSTVNTEDETVTTSGNALTRAFQNPGTKTISVLVTTVDGRTGNGQTQVVVKTTPATCP